jgi:drug/metabolite transporter (DMT)-like permease
MICFAMLAFAANSLLCRLALKHTNIDAASFSVVRLASGVLVLWLICALRRSSSTIKGSWKGAAALFVYVFAFSFAYRHLETGTGALLLFGAVQLSMVLYGVFKGERMHTLAVVGFVLAIVGLVSLLLPGAAAPDPVSALTMLLSGVAWGIYSLLGKTVADPLATTTGNFLRSIPLVLMASVPFLSALRWDPQGILYAVLSGALASGVGYAVWYVAVRHLAAFQAATVQLSVPILASLAGIVFLGESLSVRMVLASIAVLGGVALVLGGKHGRATGS